MRESRKVFIQYKPVSHVWCFFFPPSILFWWMALVSTIHNKLLFDRDSHVRSRNLRWTDEYWTLYLYGESNNRIGRLIPSSCIIHSLPFAHSLFFRSFWSLTFAKAIHFLSLITRQRIWFICFIGGNVDNEMHEEERRRRKKQTASKRIYFVV